MKIKNTLLGVGLAALVTVLCGCDPDDVEIEVTTAALKAASTGETGRALCTITFDTEMAGDEFKAKLPQIRERIQPMLGPRGKIQSKADKLVASFSAAVCGPSGCSWGKEGPYRVVVKNGKVTCEATPMLRQISDALEEIDMTLEYKDNPKQLTWRIVGEGEPMTVAAKSVFVDAKAYLDYEKKFAEGDEVEILFPRAAESVYSQIQPFLMIK